MTTKDEALQKAITAMKGVWAVGLTGSNVSSFEAAMNSLEEALAEQPAQQEPIERTAWLIEFKATTTWLSTLGYDGWTNDANKAIQFPTMEVAEEVFERLFHKPRVKALGLERGCFSITEHMFIAEQPVQQREPANLFETFQEFGEGWESLAWELCADENGEETCTELIWEGGPIPEPWGARWLKYEDEAKRLIALVQKHTSPPQRKPLTDEEIREACKPAIKANFLVGDATAAYMDVFGYNNASFMLTVARAIEAKIKEMNA